MTLDEAAELLGPEAFAHIQQQVESAPPLSEDQLNVLLPLFTAVPAQHDRAA